MPIDTSGLTAQQQATAIYVAYFDRAPDPAGLQFWTNQLQAGVSLDDVATAFSTAAETKAKYPFFDTPDVLSSGGFLTQVYANLFGRAPDAEGLEFWTGKLDSGEIPVGEIILNILESAQSEATGGFPDEATINNKIEVGLDWAEKAAAEGIGTSGNPVAQEVDGQLVINNQAAFDSATTVLVNVDGTEQSVTDAKAATDAFVGGGGGVGQTLTLTDGADTLVGTAGNDTFRGLLDGSADETLTNFDDLNGAGGVDTFNLLVETNANQDLPSGFSIANIEVVNLVSDGTGTLGNAGVTDATEFTGATQVWSVGFGAAQVNAGAGQTIGFRDTALQTVEAQDGVASVAVALDGATEGTALTAAEATAGDVTSVTVSGSVADGNSDGTSDFNLTLAGLTAVETLNLSMSNDGVITYTASAGPTLTTADLSGSTGDITLDLDDETALETFTGGSGADMLAVNHNTATADITINGGDGNDTFVTDADLGNTNGVQLTLTGGAGQDTYDFTGALAGDDFVNIADETNFENEMIVITDFSPANDVLDFTGLDRDTLTNTELSNIAGAASLEDAVDAAAAVTTAAEVSLFNYGGDAYVLHNAAGTALSNGDGLIKLTGVADIDDLDSSALVF